MQEEGPFAHFGYLSRNITKFFRTGVAPYPVRSMSRHVLRHCSPQEKGDLGLVRAASSGG